ncbi:uncharacterized protein LOC100868810 [Apis florea]|uniref:uncharacterized protein LOC100868810 n=1 Tax=Apis florea TaxID=7463 RepID=UPI000252C031|nr:uncharacterized protein LOC100868810 [Apis florea]
MKIIVVLFALCICVGALTLEELKSELLTAEPICMTETGANQQIIDDINNGIVYVEDENVQLYVECMMKRFNIVDEYGNFMEKYTRDVVGAVLNDDEVNQLVSECSPIYDANVHLKISNILQCFFKYKTINDILNS